MTTDLEPVSSSVPESLPGPETSRPSLRFRFTLQFMFFLTATAGLLFAVSRWLGPLWALSIFWFVVLIAAHVVGNALGKKNFEARRFGDHSDQSGSGDASGLTNASGLRDAGESVTRCDRLRALNEKTSAELSAVPLPGPCWRSVGMGAGLGGLTGFVLMFFVPWDDRVLAGMLVATSSTGVLGGLAGFYVSSFCQVSRSYLDLATAELRAERERELKHRRPQA